MTHLGPLLAASLIRNVGGNAARSELDRISEPLKKLVTQHVKAKLWLEQALADASFPSSRVTPEEKSMFLKKVLRSASLALSRFLAVSLMLLWC